jgi:hypothetical protein
MQAEEEEQERIEFDSRGWCDIVRKRDHSLGQLKDEAICGITGILICGIGSL